MAGRKLGLVNQPPLGEEGSSLAQTLYPLQDRVCSLFLYNIKPVHLLQRASSREHPQESLTFPPYLWNPGNIAEMSHRLLYWPDPYFYAIGNTPAVYLAQHLAPEESADALLLGCGDPRSILFTNYFRGNSATSDLDFTCCDTDPAVLGECSQRRRFFIYL